MDPVDSSCFGVALTQRRVCKFKGKTQWESLCGKGEEWGAQHLPQQNR
jgi:hypothetical protein